MANAARRFRIEMNGETAVADNQNGDMGAERHREILAAIANIGESVETTGAASTEIVEDYRTRMEEARALRDEMESIQQAISNTKLELAALHVGPGGRDINRVTDELDAVVQGTEAATEQLLQAAELIDNDANDLAATLRSASNKDLINDVRDQVVKIFEACNFQDLTGQRITKVVDTLRFIEDRVEKMMTLWGGLEAFLAPENDTVEDGTVMHGPALEADVGVASQDDIDALFD